MKLVLHLPEIDVARTISKIPSIKTLVIQICKQFNKHNLEDNLEVKVSLEVNLEDKVDNLEDNLAVQTISIQIFLLVAQAILIIPTVLLEAQIISDLVKP